MSEDAEREAKVERLEARIRELQAAWARLERAGVWAWRHGHKSEPCAPCEALGQMRATAALKGDADELEGHD